MFFIAVILIAIVAAMLAALVASILWRRRQFRRLREQDTPRCPHCGYNLTGLDLPRCPECGKAMGFDKTFAELGIDEREVLEHMERKRKEPGPQPRA